MEHKIKFMPTETLLVLFVKLRFMPEKQAQFEAYERNAAAIMREYGGAITLAFRPADEPGVEWHIVTFPDAAALAAYRQDKRVAALKPQREALIVSSEIIPVSAAAYLQEEVRL